GDVFAEIVAAFAAGFAGAAGEPAIGDDAIADLERHTARRRRGRVGGRPDGDDFTGRLNADNERQLALGERHAAPAPYVNVIEADGLDGDLHFAGRWCWRGGHFDKLDLAVADEAQRAHAPFLRLAAGGLGSGGSLALAAQRGRRGVAHAGSRVMMRETFWPPKPKELEMTRLTRVSRATFGTTSSGIAGSGTW